MKEVVSIFIYLVIQGILPLLKFILAISITLIIYAFIRNIYHYRKYGYKKFNFLKKRNINNYKQNLLFLMLTKLKGYRKIINSDELSTHLIVIDETGIYLLYLFNYDGIINGQFNDNNLIKKISKYQSSKIPNPFLIVNKDQDFIFEKIGLVSLYKYIIINNQSLFDVKYNDAFEIVYFKDFYHKIEVSFKNNKKVYSREEINKYYIMFNNMSNNVKK